MNSSGNYQYLNPDTEEDEDLSDPGESKNRRILLTHNQKPRLIHAAIITFLIISNISFCVLWLKARPHEARQHVSDCVRPQLIYSPATSAIRYVKKRLWRDIDGPNPFTGKPRPDFDKAWHEIVAPITIKVSGSELERFSEGDSTIAFKDGSGYIAELGVYHELHCVKRVRRYLSLENYYPNMTDEDRVKEDAHVDHCLEYWRESAMCRGDTTLGTFFWRDGVPTSRVYTDNECVDWDALDHWARQRRVDMSDYSQFE
ncbi:hypothetical protein F4801DRAFT_548030 [Xylaria longipes]|nr:hypothetical protein F4801DRAFT_548030 [Xylaria longipes]RYC59731.1 hypothetical protein CHU98_g6478 [Xylaria longipes]